MDLVAQCYDATMIFFIVASWHRRPDSIGLIQLRQAILILSVVAFVAEIEFAQDLRGLIGLCSWNQHTHRPQRAASKAIDAAKRLALEIHGNTSLLQVGARNLRT